MYLMWSGSPASLASNPMKRAVSDETNKFEEWAGKEASPVELTDRRLTTYPDAIHILISSPTTSAGVISVNFEASDVKLYFCVRCPGCGKWQRLVFDNVIIPDELLKMADNNEAAKICNQTQAAHYQCPACEQHIDDRMRRKLIREGKWMTVDPDNKVFADGVIEDAMEIEAFPNETRVGMHISSLYWMWERVTISSIAATYLRAINDPLAMFEFRTGDLGEDADITHAQITLNTFEILSKTAETPEALLPDWTDRILLTVDTQQDHFYGTLRAWGSHMVSRRVWHGNVQTFKDLTDLMCRSWPYQSGWLPAIRPMLMLIDSGGTRTDVNEESSTRTQEVYAYTLNYPAQVIPLKGASKPRDTRDLHWFGRGIHNPHAQNASRRQEIRLLMVDSNQAQDMLDRMINTQIKIIDPFTGEERDDFQQWGLNQANDDTYNRQMTNLHKMMDKVDGKLVERWCPVKDGARHDYRDCEGYQIVAAYLTGVHLIPSLPQWYKLKKEQHRASATTQFLQTPKTPDGREYFANNR